MAGLVLTLLKPERDRRLFQACRQRERHGGRHRAAVSLDRDHGPAVARRQDVAFDQALEVIVPSGDEPVGIPRGLDDLRRHWVARNPNLDRTVVDREAIVPEVGRRVGGIFVRTHLGQIESAPGFAITM